MAFIITVLRISFTRKYALRTPGIPPQIAPPKKPANIEIVITNQPGNLGSLTTVIGKNLGNISNLKITNRSIDFFEVLVDVEVKDVRHLTNIIAALRATPAISSVDRARG